MKMSFFTTPVSRSLKQFLMMLADSIMIVLALAFSFVLLGNDFFAQEQSFYLYLSVATILSILAFIRIGLYRAIVLYMGLQSGFVVLQRGNYIRLLTCGFLFLLAGTTNLRLLLFAHLLDDRFTVYWWQSFCG